MKWPWSERWQCVVALLCVFLPLIAHADPGCPSAASVPAPPKTDTGTFESPTPGVWNSSRVLIVGDSIAARWDPALDMPAYNFGHGGDRTQWILWRLQHADTGTAHFQNAIVIAGTNNSGPHFTACEIAGGVFAIVKELKDRYSVRNIVVLSLLPRGRELSQNEENIEQTNQILGANASQLGYHYADAFSRFRQLCDHANTCGLYLPGLIHPTPQGYRIIEDLVKPALR